MNIMPRILVSTCLAASLALGCADPHAASKTLGHAEEPASDGVLVASVLMAQIDQASLTQKLAQTGIVPRNGVKIYRLSYQTTTPDQALDNEQFWQVFNDCLSRLPKKMADLFVLRTLENLSSEECCKVLELNSTNQLWVTLSRTRMKLRQCLDTRWFDKE